MSVVSSLIFLTCSFMLSISPRVWWVSIFFLLIHIIFPSRSVSINFDLSKYLKIVLICVELNFPSIIFCKFLILIYSVDFSNISRKKSISSSLTLFIGLLFFFFCFIYVIYPCNYNTLLCNVTLWEYCKRSYLEFALRYHLVISYNFYCCN